MTSYTFAVILRVRTVLDQVTQHVTCQNKRTHPTRHDALARGVALELAIRAQPQQHALALQAELQ
jgi:hypothetical protein